jgi:hypothetical protein
MLKRLAESWNVVKKQSTRTDINRKIWCHFSFDRKEPTLKLHDNTSFIELNSKDVADLRKYLISLDDTE